MTDDRILRQIQIHKERISAFDLSKVVDRFSPHWKDSEGERTSSTMGTYGVSFWMQRFKFVTEDCNPSLQPTNIAIIKLNLGGRRVTNWKIYNIRISMVVSTKLIFLKYTEAMNIIHTHSLHVFHQANVERGVTDSHSKNISGVSTYPCIVQIFGTV